MRPQVAAKNKWARTEALTRNRGFVPNRSGSEACLRLHRGSSKRYNGAVLHTVRLGRLLFFLACFMPLQAIAQEVSSTDPMDARVAECTRTMDRDCMITLAASEAAADAFTRFAREHRDDPQAPVALARSVDLWRELGQPERVLDTAREFRRTFPTHSRLADVAEDVFLVGELYQHRSLGGNHLRQHHSGRTRGASWPLPSPQSSEHRPADDPRRATRVLLSAPLCSIRGNRREPHRQARQP